jgi:hypothetical protein
MSKPLPQALAINLPQIQIAIAAIAANVAIACGDYPEAERASDEFEKLLIGYKQDAKELLIKLKAMNAAHG